MERWGQPRDLEGPSDSFGEEPGPETWANRPHDCPGAGGGRNVVGGFPSASDARPAVHTPDHGAARFILSSVFTPGPLNVQVLTRLGDHGKSLSSPRGPGHLPTTQLAPRTVLDSEL